MQTLFKNNVAAIIEQLKLTDLRPSTEVNSLYSELVSLALDPERGMRELLQLNMKQLREVHAICAEGESRLEQFWAQRIVQSKIPLADLLNFPYLDNYLKLSGQELALFVKHLPKHGENKLAYIGSGPLPLTAICYERHGLFNKVVGIDSSEQAISISRQVCRKLGSGVIFTKSAAQNIDYSEYSLVFVAALVGMTNNDKQAILRCIQKTAKPGALVAVRSAYGSRELLYPKLEAIPSGYQEVATYIPTDDVVNSMHLLKIGGKHD